jgi:hypothetical protein
LSARSVLLAGVTLQQHWAAESEPDDAGDAAGGGLLPQATIASTRPIQLCFMPPRYPEDLRVGVDLAPHQC